MKLWTSSLLFFVFSFCGFAQNGIDSIEQSLQNRKIDTSLISDYILLASHYRKEDSIKSYDYSIRAIETSDELLDKLWKGRSLYSLGQYYTVWEYDLDRASIHYNQALEIFRLLNADHDELEITLRLGAVYVVNQDEKKAFELYQSALERHENDDRYGMIINNSIGVMMKGIGESDKAIQYMDKSEEHYELLENPERMIVSRQISNDKNRGVLYRNNESYDTAVFYFDRGLSVALELNDTIWMGSIYNSVALMYEQQNLYLQAVEAFEKSLELKRAQNYEDGIKTSLTNIGGLYIKMGDYQKAKVALEEAESIQGNGIRPQRELNVLNELSILYFEIGKPKLAYEKLRAFISLSDSVESAMNISNKQDLEAKYQNNLLKIEEDKLKAELIASNLREASHEADLKQQRTFMILGVSFTIILLILVVVAIRSNLKRKAANNELTQKNLDISQKSDKIEFQKHQIEEKNQEIMDSINYAKRIQDAILPNDDFFKQHLNKSFIYYQPKDVLAGDFYWMDVLDDTIIWAAADCTGHGIPGALVSVVCHNALNRSVHEFGLKDPAKILDCTRDLVIETFEKSGMEVKDGMDIALCCLDKKTNVLAFAGANNPLWLIRKNENDQLLETDITNEDATLFLREIKGDKQPIGLHYSKEPFKLKQLQLLKDDLLYVFTDGFADQFGGEKGKKLKYKNFKKLILEGGAQSISIQEKEISSAFNNWKGDFEQLDDVCVIGVRV